MKVLLNVALPNGAGWLYGPLGAGGGKLAALEFTLVGLKIPLVSGPLSGTKPGAASLNVSDTPATGLTPPASDIRMSCAPVGLTRSNSKSSGRSVIRLLSVTLMPQMAGGRPVTMMRDG